MRSAMFSAAQVRESVTGVTRILAGKNVRVTQQGSSAFVESDKDGVPIRVNIPYVPDEADQLFLDAIQGFIDHEVAHILFTDFRAAQEAFPAFKMDESKDTSERKGMTEEEYRKHIETAARHSMFNVIEDTLIEREMRKRFRGSRRNLDNTCDFFLRKFSKPKLDEALAANDEKMVQAVISVPAIRAFAQQTTFQEWMDEDNRWQHFEYFTEKVPQEVLDEIADVNCTADSIRVANAIMDKIYEEPEIESSESESQQSDQQCDQQGEGQCEGQGEGQGEAKSKSQSQEQDEGEEESTGSSEDQSEKGEDENGDQTKATKKSKSDKEKDDDQPDAATAMASMKDFSDAISDELTKMSEQVQADSNYVPFTTDNDFTGIHKISRHFDPLVLQELEEETASMTGELQRKLERIMVTRSKARMMPGRKSGKLHSANVARLRVGDQRVFRKKISDKMVKDVSVSLVIDCSGSMHGYEIKLATTAALAMGSVLDRIDIDCEISGFTTSDFPNRKAEQEAVEQMNNGTTTFNRYIPIINPIFKTFEESMGVVQKHRLADVLCNGIEMYTNVDGESIQLAAARLLKQKSARKVMIVLSDGMPNGYWGAHGESGHLKHVVQECERIGIQMIGIGIDTNAVEEFYKENVVLRDIEELPKSVMSKLSSVLVK